MIANRCNKTIVTSQRKSRYSRLPAADYHGQVTRQNNYLGADNRPSFIKIQVVKIKWCCVQGHTEQYYGITLKSNGTLCSCIRRHVIVSTTYNFGLNKGQNRGTSTVQTCCEWYIAKAWDTHIPSYITGWIIGSLEPNIANGAIPFSGPSWPVAPPGKRYSAHSCKSGRQHIMAHTAKPSGSSQASILASSAH